MSSSFTWAFTLTLICSPFTKRILRFLLHKTLLKIGSWITLTTLKKLKHKSMNHLGIKMVEKISKQYYEYKYYLDEQVDKITKTIKKTMEKPVPKGTKFVLTNSEMISLVRMMESLTEHKTAKGQKEEEVVEEMVKMGLEVKLQVDGVSGEEVVVVEELDLKKSFEEIG